MQIYKTIKQYGEGEIVEKKSRFLGKIKKVETEEEALEFIESIKKQYWDARHNCFAYIIGTKGETVRCSDDGEPSGTAGGPMLNILNGKDTISTDGTFTFPRGIGINFGSGTMKGSSTYGDLIINNIGGYTYLAVNGTNILSVRSDGLYANSPFYCVKSLYDNGTGTTGTVTLSETAANFNYLEIFYRKNRHIYYYLQNSW